MHKKALVIVLCCMAVPYLYWHLLVDEDKPVHSLSNYLKNYASPYLNHLGFLVFNDSDVNSYDPIPDDPTSSDQVTPDEDIASVIDQVITSGEAVTSGNKRTTSINTNLDFPDPGVKSGIWSSAHPENKEIINEGVLIDSNTNMTSLVTQTGLSPNILPLKKILFWNRLRTGYKNFGLGSGQGAFLRLGCEFNACTVTGSRDLYPYEELDAVVWHERSRDESFPPRRSPHTRYIFMNGEPPGHVKRMKKHRNVFNWTLSYRWDSEISMRIGQLVPRQVPWPDNSHINFAAGKTKMAAWFVSNCGTDSGRSQVSKQLKKYFQVDVYGKCGILNCPRSTSVDCYKKAEKHYKFYLSFENSLCRDYVTEKFFKVLLYNIVPVVYGGADYTAIAPKKSYINVRDFPSIDALAKYLLYLNSNDTAYNEYFRWKSHYDVLAVGNSKSLAWCDLCKRLHTDNTTHIYPDIHEWFIRQARCQSRKYGAVKRFING